MTLTSGVFKNVLFSWMFFSLSVAAAGVPHSTVQTLTARNFQTNLADPANGLWLLKFYAPWCGHCKRFAPVLDDIAPKVKGKMAIGKIDCTQEKKLCNAHNIKGYPTLKFSLDGDIADYPGSRKAEHIMAFANKMSQSPLTVVNSYEEVLQVASENEDGIVFVAYHPQLVGKVNVEEDMQKTILTQAFAQVARKNQASAHFCLLAGESEDVLTIFKEVLTNGDDDIDSELNDGFVAKVEVNNSPIMWKPNKEASSSELLVFVKENNTPLISALGPHNFQKIGDLGRPLVMGVVDGDNRAQIEAMKEELADYARKGPQSIVQRYHFGWIDGKLWHKFLRQFQVRPDALPKIFVLNVPKKKYWSSDEYNTVAGLLEAVNNGTVQSRVAGSSGKGVMGTFKKAEFLFFRYLPWSLVGLVAVCVAIVLMILPAPEEMRPPYHKKSQPTQPEGSLQSPISMPPTMPLIPSPGADPDQVPVNESKKDK